MGGKASLVVVIGFAFILGYISLNLNNAANRAAGNSSLYAAATASHNLATIGANVGLAKFYQDTSWFGSITQEFTGQPLKGSFTTTMENLGGDRLRLRSVSSYEGPIDELNDTVDVYFSNDKKSSFSIFAWITNIEGNRWWITGDTVWGRVHSNDLVHVYGSPVFMKKITTRASFDPAPGSGTNQAIFKDGYETGVARIDFPENLSELTTAASAGGRTYDIEIWATLSPGTAEDDDGVVFIRAAQTGPVIDTIVLNEEDFNGVVLGEGRVNVGGTLDGTLSLVSLVDIYIQDDVLYEQNPRFTYSNDLLGLVAERDIVVAENAANNNNCEIHGNVFARTGSFYAQNYDWRPPSGELRVLGSLAQNTRGAVGTFAGSPPMLNHGFYKRYRYDDRLDEPAVRPPSYPRFAFRSYSITDWWESAHAPDLE